jgi:hypothetical protein
MNYVYYWGVYPKYNGKLKRRELPITGSNGFMEKGYDFNWSLVSLESTGAQGRGREIMVAESKND